MIKYLKELALPLTGMYRLIVFLLLWLPGLPVLAIDCPIFPVSGGGSISTGQTASVTLTGATPLPITYDLFRDGVLVGAASKQGTGSNLTWTVSQAGTYTVKATEPCLATMSGQAVVTINTLPPPTPPTITRVVNGTGCSQAPLDTPVLLQAIGSNGTYSWYDLAGNLKAETTTTTGTASWTPEILMETSYRVTVTNANGTSAPMVVTASLYKPPSASISIAGSTTICQGQTVALTASAGVSYRWSNGATTQSINAAASGSYSVTITQQYGCQVTSEAVTVTVKPLPTASITQSGWVVSFGQGNELSLSVSTCSGCSYQWSFSRDGSTNWVNEATAVSIPVAKTGYYRVAVTSNGCTFVTAPFGKVTANEYNYIITNSIQKAGVTTQNQLNALTAGSIQQSIMYFDGLGQPMQSVTTQGSPLGKDLVQPIQYDERGREAIKYLPLTDETNGLFKATAISPKSPIVDPTAYSATKQYKFYQNGNGVTGIAYDTQPFAQSLYEASPLHRITEQGSPGLAWQPGGLTAKTVKTIFRLNRASEVRLFTYSFSLDGTYGKVSSTDVNSAFFYGAGQLYVTEAMDERGYKTLEFTDKQGQVVLKKVQYKGTSNSTTSPPDADCLLTYSIYDCFSRIRMTIQPEGSELIPATGIFTPTADVNFINNWCFTYHYDDRGRLSEKKVPGAGVVYMVYNSRDGLILTQDAKQRASQQWSVTKYDSLGRVVMRGLYVDPSVDMLSMQRLANASTVNYENKYIGLQGYTVNKSFPALLVTGDGKDKIYTVNYYNEYDTDRNGTKDRIYEGTGYFDRTIGQLTASKVARTDNTGWLISAFFYDKYGRVIQTQVDNHLGGRQLTNNLYDDFTNRVKSSQILHNVILNNAATMTVNKEFSYDSYSRLTKIAQQNNADTKIILAEYAYNELGQLITKKVGGTLQTMDYRYNIRGWLSTINQDALQTPTKERLFGLALLYNKDLTNVDLPVAQQQFNGNVAIQKWKSFVSLQATSSPPVERTYTYSYDPPNRITGAQYSQSAVGAGENFTMSNVTYSKNGNIRSLQQNGLLSYTTTATQLKAQFGSVDNLSYTYTGNRLTKVEEVDTDADPLKVSSNVSATGLAGDFQNKDNKPIEYTYDDNAYGGNGNLVTDLNKGIYSILYNYLNLPTKIVMNDAGTNWIEYLYDAAGTKLRKKVYIGGFITDWTDYAGGFVYQKDVLQFFGTEEGRVLTPYFVPQATGLVYEYHYKDQLGSLRLSFRQNRATVTYKVGAEDGNAVSEEANFTNVKKTRMGPNAAKAQAGSYWIALNSTTGSLGPWKTIKVKSKDVINAKVYANYTAGTVGNGVTLGTYLTQPASVQGGAESGTKLPLLQLGITFNPLPAPNSGIPKAYLRYEYFDENQTFISSDYVPVPLAASNGWIQLTMLPLTASKDGYVQIYLANESNVEVRFDEFEVNYTEPLTVQENHYNPWGNNLVGIETLGQPNSEFQYNGKEKQEELGLNWVDYGARMYDPQLGRWHMVDPMTDGQQAWTPYHYVYNNPILRTDPDGRCPDGDCPGSNGEIGMMVGSVVVSVKNDIMTLAYNAGDLFGITPTAQGMKWEAVEKKVGNRYETVMQQVPRQGLVRDVSGHLLNGASATTALSPGNGATTGLLAKFGGKTAIVNGITQTAKKLHKNTNEYVGEFVIYVVKQGDELLKYGKAKAEDIMATTGENRRAHTSARKAKQQGYPDAEAEVVENLGTVSTKEAKDVEAQYARDARRNGNPLPLNKEKDKKYHP